MKKTINKPIILFFIVAALFTGHDRLMAQMPEIFVIVEEDMVYLYHMELLSLGHGYHVYRQGPGDREPVRLTAEVIRGIQRGDELPSVLGDRYQEVRTRLGQPNALTTFHRLRSSPVISNLYTMVYPEVAYSLGRLFADTTAPAGLEVTYTLEFVNQDDQPTGQTLSRQVRLIPERAVRPSALEAENQGRRVTLSWHYPLSDPADPDNIVCFNIYRLVDATGEWTRLNENIILRDLNKQQFRFQFDALAVGADESYVVTAVNMAARESDASEVLTYTVVDNLLPRAVRHLNARWIPDGSVEITWPVSIEPDVVGYNVYRSTTASEEFTRLNDTLIGLLSTVYVDREMIKGREYFYRVAAVNQAGNEGEMSNALVVFVYDFDPPPAPSQAQAVYLAEEGLVHLSWEADDTFERLYSYVVLRRNEDRDPPGAYSRLSYDEITVTELYDKGVAEAGFLEGVTYVYGVYATDRAGNQSDTAYTSVFIPKVTPPRAPTGVLAMNENGHRVRVYWNAPLSPDVDTYRVYRKRSGDEEWTHIATTNYREKTWRDTDVITGKNYLYMVSALDEVGNESDYADPPGSLFFRSMTAPRQVRDMQAIMTASGAYIRWGEVVASDMAGYIVYRSALPNGIFEPLHNGLISNTEYIDPDGSAGYWYHVCAIDTSGNASRPSAPVRPEPMQTTTYD